MVNYTAICDWIRLKTFIDKKLLNGGYEILQNLFLIILLTLLLLPNLTQQTRFSVTEMQNFVLALNYNRH